MWGQAIDTAVGLTFLFAISALLCSALVEGYATLAERRAKYLITALRNMLDMPESGTSGDRPALDPDTIHHEVKDPQATARAATALALAAAPATTAAPTPGPAAAAPAAVTAPVQPLAVVLGAETSLTAALFDHPLIRSLQTRKVRPGSDGAVRNPQYIPSSVFARALIATLLPAGEPGPAPVDVLVELRTVVDELPRRLAARRSLLAMIDQAQGRLETFQRSVEDWFDAEMGRISGWYKRWAQAVLLVVGLVVAVLANIDTLSVTHTLWVDAPVRAAVVAEATSGTLCSQLTDPQQRQDCAAKEIGVVASSGVPIGPQRGCGLSNLGSCFGSSITVDNRLGAVLLKLIGWLVTAIAISFGAPFWFDALSRLGNLRSTGPKPAGSS